MEDNSKKSGPEQTVINLLQAQSEHNVSHVNMLLMLSLVNLMGIVDVLQRTTGGEGLEVEIAPRGLPAPKDKAQSPNDDLMELVQQAASGNLHPAQLLGLLNRQGGQMSNQAALINLLSQMLPPPPPPENRREGPRQCPQAPPKDKCHEPKQPQPPKEDNVNANTNSKPVEEEKKPPGQKPVLKWDPRLG
ncbi:hypothetical protein JOC37_001575 [Desulfohalotomaculum tongense]|uniref:hypothetical protein n=1 Tax=Desulforadius tongensis TaxID=1216062 RepID=UPI0019573C0A|nr:hypothetical protein [Desulforadius tongensis]MBM7855190.1 hypothetical protein [Desulforadius tongensis]